MTDRTPETRVFRVGAEDAGARLDQFLADRCPDISRSRIARAVDDDRVRVDGRRRPRGFRLRDGSEIEFLTPPPPQTDALPQDLPLKIVHRDEHLVVVDKAPGMVVHPAPGHPDGTLVNALLHAVGPMADAGNGLRPGIVHRLDRDTSGLMVAALTPQAHHDLGDQLRDHTLGRTYLALSWGTWNTAPGVLDAPIGRHPSQKMAVLERGGREAVTHYSIREEFGFVQLCEAVLETGRTHQIRVHFTHAGHPIVGDPLYGDDRRARNTAPVDRTAALRMVKGAGRQMLHAAELRLRHPATGETMTFRADPPADFAAVLAGLRRDCGL